MAMIYNGWCMAVTPGEESREKAKKKGEKGKKDAFSFFFHGERSIASDLARCPEGAHRALPKTPSALGVNVDKSSEYCGR